MATKEQELHQAVGENNKAKVEKLLESGININCLVYGWTPLQLAVERGNQDMAVFLIEKGCDNKYHDKHTKSPFEEALINKQCKVIDSLLAHETDANQTMSSGDSALCFAVEMNSEEIVDILLKGNADANSVNSRDESALFIACQDGETEIVKKLVKAGANMNCVHEKSSNYTPLLAAVAGDHEDTVKALLKNDIHIDAQDSDGWTALMHAYSNSNEDVCEMLLKAGASVHITNNEGKTVVQEANENEDSDFILLINKYNKP